jgi:hypothetical protein
MRVNGVTEHNSYITLDSIEKAKVDILSVLEKSTQADATKSDILGTLQKDTIDLVGKIHDAKTDILGAIRQSRVADGRIVKKKGKTTPLIPNTMRKLFAGMARIGRDDFFEAFDVGVPKDDTEKGNEEVLILYSKGALPKAHSSSSLGLHSAEEATKHCNTLKVVFTEPHRERECLALVGQWESYHVSKFMRLPPGDKKIQVHEKHALRYVSRLHGNRGLVQRIPTPLKVKEYDETLVAYLSRLDKLLTDLKPIAQKVAQDNNIVVMVCNHGQSELLMNFACSAQARGFDLHQVLVFSTDLETKELAEGLGMAVFYDQTVRKLSLFICSRWKIAHHLNVATSFHEQLFDKIPKAHAAYYADETFTRVMMAKLYCVHMINMLGYNLLFQDVDVTWYRNPLEYFSNTTSHFNDYDIFFQDDGGRSIRYGPYSPNSGFYYVRHNDRTEYFFHSLLMAGNIIAQSGSHQNAVSAVLNEHASWRGLRVKTLHRKMQEFPCGFHYESSAFSGPDGVASKKLMKDLIAGQSNAYIFHMSWTGNKAEKKKFYEQMGEWYVKDECIGVTVDEIVNGTNPDLGKACCVAEPVIKCHYRDRPSKIPCKDSPPLNEGHDSWW